MRGGLQRWKRGIASAGVQQAVNYAFEGECDSHLHATSGAEALRRYSEAGDGATVTRYTATSSGLASDELDEGRLARWLDGSDPDSGERRGRELNRPDADLVLDGTINAPKSFSVASLLHPELATEFEALQDRLRDRVVTTWQRELNARRGAAGSIREQIAQLEVVELQHRRSRALDPHIHRHLWLNARVRGEDGRWSNVDSRVAMKLHTLVNAEGEVAMRTDPVWIAALARHGYTLSADGEIEQLEHIVRPLSRRSNQIEANRAARLAEWRQSHPGQEASPDVLTAIDRWAWAYGRPNKPGQVDELSWEQLTRDELRGIDPAITDRRDAMAVRAVAIADLDRDLLAAQATVEADARATATGGRFGLFDLRAGALRAIAASGVVAARELLAEVADDVAARAHQLSVNVLPDERAEIPGHVKHLMAAATAALKVDLGAAFDRLSASGERLDVDEVDVLAAAVLDEGRRLDASQTEAVCAIAGSNRLVAVTGPAGTGKTTLLKVAKAALEGQGRRMVIVAPTKKAASVAGREVGAQASSLHSLLLDHGWRWSVDDAGAQAWRRLNVGEVDERTGAIYEGPRRYVLDRGDRVVVDEAGMVDLYTALALSDVLERTGADVAMVGDHLQASPVGHSGAMAMLRMRAGACVELSAVHRFRDPEYAALSLRLREPGSAEEALLVAQEIDRKGLLKVVSTEEQAREHMVDAYMASVVSGQRLALVTSTNAEARHISETIQERLVKTGVLSETTVAVGQDEQRLLVGDIVQTRRNNAAADVENRALWRIAAVSDEGIQLVSLTDSTDRREVTPEYLAAHVHLAYASTVHGIQGETTDAAIVGPGVDAAGLYVGMTRGRIRNEAVVVADRVDTATRLLSESMMRGGQEVTLDDAGAAAGRELGRAARAPQSTAADERPATWDDRHRRPLGAIIDLDRYLGDAPALAGAMREDLESLNDRIHRDHAALRAVKVRLATIEARGHAAAVAGSEPVTDSALPIVAERLEARITASGERRGDMVKEYAVLVRRVDRVEDERRVRSSLPREVSEAERRARLTHAQAQGRPPGPAAAPEGPGRGL